MNFWQRDSDTVFTAISTSGAANFKEASQMLMMYIMDETFSRAGISDAHKRLERFYESKS